MIKNLFVLLLCVSGLAIHRDEDKVQLLSKLMFKLKLQSKFCKLEFCQINLGIGRGVTTCLKLSINDPDLEQQCLQILFNNDYFWS